MRIKVKTLKRSAPQMKCSYCIIWRLIWKNTNVRSAVTFTIRKRATRMGVFLQIPLLQNFLITGSALPVAPLKICSKKPKGSGKLFLHLVITDRLSNHLEIFFIKPYFPVNSLEMFLVSFLRIEHRQTNGVDSSPSCSDIE